MRKLCIAVIFCMFFSGCASYKNDVPVQLIATTLCKKIEGSENLAEASPDYIKYCMDSDLSLFSEYIVLYPFAGIEYNEIGIFKVKSLDDIKAATAEIDRYILFKKSNWDTRYLNDEFKKTDNSKPIICGNYIFYTILSKEESNAAINIFEKLIKK